MGKADRAVRRMMILGNISTERLRQIAKWGEQTHWDDTGTYYETMRDEYQRVNDLTVAAGGDPGWTPILLEEVYEALSEDDPVRLREELVQSAAVIVAWIEDIDTRERA